MGDEKEVVRLGFKGDRSYQSVVGEVEPKAENLGAVQHAPYLDFTIQFDRL